MKQKAFRRALAWALVLIMALSALPFAALAEGTEPAPAGQETPKVEEPKQEAPAPKAEDDEGEEPKQETPPPRAEDGNGEEPKSEAPNQEANAETPKPQSEGDAGAQDAEAATFTVQVRVDDKMPTTAWHIWVYSFYDASNPENNIAAQKSGSDGSSYQDMTFTLPKLPDSFSYSVRVSVKRNGEDVFLTQFVGNGKTSAFNFYTRTVPRNITFTGEDLFRQCSGELTDESKQAIVDSALAKIPSPHSQGWGDISVSLSNRYTDSEDVYKLSADVKFPAYGVEVSPSGAVISLRLTGLSGKLYVFTEDGTPISTDPTSGTYYTSDSTTLELHNFQEGRYQFRSFETPVTVTFDGNGGTVSQSCAIVERGTELDLSAFTASRFGYHFDGWENDGSSVGSSITPTEDTTLQAKWDPVTITVYDSGAGSVTPYSPELQGIAIIVSPDQDNSFYWGCSDDQGRIWTTFDFSEDRELTVQYFNMRYDGMNGYGSDKLWLAAKAPELRASFPYTGLADLVTEMKITAAEIAPSEALTALARQTLQAENVQLQAYDFGVTLTKGGEAAPLTEFDRTLLFYVPWSGSADRVAVLRTHDGSTEVLPQGKPADNTTEGWYIENGRLYFAVSKFSEYAIAAAPIPSVSIPTAAPTAPCP